LEDRLLSCWDNAAEIVYTPPLPEVAQKVAFGIVQALAGGFGQSPAAGDPGNPPPVHFPWEGLGESKVVKPRTCCQFGQGLEPRLSTFASASSLENPTCCISCCMACCLHMPWDIDTSSGYCLSDPYAASQLVHTRTTLRPSLLVLPVGS